MADFSTTDGGISGYKLSAKSLVGTGDLISALVGTFVRNLGADLTGVFRSLGSTRKNGLIAFFGEVNMLLEGVAPPPTCTKSATEKPTSQANKHHRCCSRCPARPRTRPHSSA